MYSIIDSPPPFHLNRSFLLSLRTIADYYGQAVIVSGECGAEGESGGGGYELSLYDGDKANMQN